jgi:hypothetical protein
VTGPGSFCEVRKLLPLLTVSSPEHPSFHVVALSLPGYGFSEAPRKQGFSQKQFAEVCDGILHEMRDLIARSKSQVAHKLMLALGYHEYGNSRHQSSLNRQIDVHL